MDADAQTLSFRIGYMSSSSTAAKVYVLHGEGYGTSTQVGYYTCTSSPCKWNWYTKWIDAEPYRGQSIKMKFERYVSGTVGVDDVGPLLAFD